MTKAKEQLKRSSCSECPSSFELIPPADQEYNVPREKPKSDDYLKRIYECEEGGHRNTIYWEKEEFFVSSVDLGSESRRPYMSTKYGRESQIGIDRL